MRLTAGQWIALILIGGWVYLFAANAYFYHRLHAGNLMSPAMNASYAFPGTKRITYVALGDSLTAGVGTDTFEDGYVYGVAKKMSEKRGVTMHAYAYPGVRTAGLLADYVPKAINAKPDIITLLIGTNDIHGRVSAEEFEENYRAILKELKKTGAKIYAVSIPFVGSHSILLPPFNLYFDRETEKFNNVIRRLAVENGVDYIDIATPTKILFESDGAHYSFDSFHPSALGYKLWADVIYASIDK